MLLPGITLFLLLGCSETTFGFDGDQGFWEGQLVDQGTDGGAELAGRVTMASAGARTEIVMEIVSGPSTEALGWGVAFGSCEAPGEPLASAEDFGFIELDGAGEGEARQFVGGGFSQDSTFVAAVFPGVLDQSEMLACADLTALSS